MPKICTSVTTPVTTFITEKVDTWVETQEERCNQYPWWDPRGWFCWFVTILVMVTSWVVKNIIVYTTEIICTFTAWTIGYPLSWIFAACFKCYDWILLWFIKCPKIEGPEGYPSKEFPDQLIFLFRCNCNCFQSKLVEITAISKEEAIELAKEKCAEACK
jgi:hypothetical protein